MFVCVCVCVSLMSPDTTRSHFSFFPQQKWITHMPLFSVKRCFCYNFFLSPSHLATQLLEAVGCSWVQAPAVLALHCGCATT